ncbi:MAG: STAS domain-containing protein [Acidobacteriota bacterium]
MEITTRTVGKGVVLDCSGKITLGPATMTVRNAIREAIQGGNRKLVLNLKDVPYIDSSGIGELVSSYTHVCNQGGKMVLLSPSKRVREPLAITKLITVFEVFEDEKLALEGS